MQSPVHFGGLRRTRAEQGLPSWRPHSSKALAGYNAPGLVPFSTGFGEILKEPGKQKRVLPGATAGVHRAGRRTQVSLQSVSQSLKQQEKSRPCPSLCFGFTLSF